MSLVVQQNAFETGYEKFKTFVKDQNLIPPERNRVVVAYSGGKDASLLCDFLWEYKQRVRSDLELEIVKIGFPRFLYESTDPDRAQAVEKAVGLWTERGFVHTAVDAGPEYPDSILEGDNPCRQCAVVIKPGLLARQIAKSDYKDAVYCVGLTLDDIIGWFIELILVGAGRESFDEVRETNSELFNVMMYLATRVTCRLEVEHNNLLYSRPLMCFTDTEIRNIVSERNLPLIPEDCSAVQKRDDFIDSPRREICDALEAIRKKYPIDSNIGRDSLYSDYMRAVSYFGKSNLLPSLKDRENYASRVLTKSYLR